MRLSLQQFPLLTLGCSLVAILALPVLTVLYAGSSLLFWLRPSGDQPQYIRQHYDGDGSAEGGAWRLRGDLVAATAGSQHAGGGVVRHSGNGLRPVQRHAR